MARVARKLFRRRSHNSPGSWFAAAYQHHNHCTKRWHVGTVGLFALAKGITFKFNFYRETPQTDPRLSLLNAPQGVIDGVKAAFSAIEANLPPWNLVDGLIDLSYFSAPHRFACGSRTKLSGCRG